MTKTDCEDKAFCVQCLQEVDPNTHMDCSLTFQDMLLDTDEIDETRNLQQNEFESTVKPHQGNNSSKSRIYKDSGKRKPDFYPEISAKNPKQAISSNKSSTSPLAQGVHNPEVQKTEYGNNISCHKENNGLYNCPYTSSYAERFKMANLETNPILEDPTYNKYKAGQKALENVKQRKHDFGSVYQQRNESLQENSQLIYGQSVATNVLEAGSISDFRSGFTNPFPQERVDAFGYIKTDPVVYYPKLLNPYASYGPHPIITNLQSNTRVEIYPQNLNLLPNGSQHTVNLNNPMRSAMTENKEMELHGQNKHPSTDLVAKTETQSDCRGNFSTSPRDNVCKAFTEGTQQIHAERSTLKYPENSMYQTEVKSASHKRTQQKNAQQKNADLNAQQKNADLNAQQKNADLNAQQKNADMNAQQRNADMNAQQRNADMNAQQKNADMNAQQKNVDMNAQQKNADMNAQKKHERKHKKLVKDEKFEQYKQTVEITEEKHLKQEKSFQQENSNVFTGKGYETIEDFINALKNGTLYKRY